MLSMGGVRSQETFTEKAVAEIAQMRIPYTREFPVEGAFNSPPAVLLRGFLGEEKDYAKLRHSLAVAGVEAITFSSPRGPGALGNFHPLHLFSVGTIESIAAYGVIRHIKSRSDHKMVDLIGHSLGGRTATNVAIEKPASVRSVTYVGSACLTSHTWPQSIGRSRDFLSNDFWDYIVNEHSYNPYKLAADGLLRAARLFQNPLKNISELMTAARGNLQDDLQTVQQYGIKTAALQTENDPYSPPTEAYAIKDLFDIIKSIPGDHLVPQKKPDETARAIVEIQNFFWASTDLKMAA